MNVGVVVSLAARRLAEGSALARDRNWNDAHGFAFVKVGINIECLNLNANLQPGNSNDNFGFRPIVRLAGTYYFFLMKAYKNLFLQICSADNLRLACKRARKGKADKYYVKQFGAELESNLGRLSAELLGGSYHPLPLHRFVVRDPKTRVIHAPAFRDRVVHHAICNVLEPIFDKTFIFDSYASRKGKGTHAALMRFDEFERKVTLNGRVVPHALNNNMICGFALKADIRHYFPSVNHEILMRLFGRKISDRRVLALLRLILESYAPQPGKGMPLGALTSQLFANVYLDTLDHFVKERLGTKFYLRYLDDFVILHDSRKQLEEWKVRIAEFLRTDLKLELHPEKTSIFPLHRGVTFLGFRCFYYHRLLKASNLAQFRRRLAAQKQMVSDGQLSAEGLERSVEGWLGHAKWANTYRLRKRIKYAFGPPTSH